MALIIALLASLCMESICALMFETFERKLHDSQNEAPLPASLSSSFLICQFFFFIEMSSRWVVRVQKNQTYLIQRNNERRHLYDFIFSRKLFLVDQRFFLGDVCKEDLKPNFRLISFSSDSGSSAHQARKYFPNVSSESDLQRYKTITFRKQPSNETRTSSTVSNQPSDSNKTKVSKNDGFLISFC